MRKFKEVIIFLSLAQLEECFKSVFNMIFSMPWSYSNYYHFSQVFSSLLKKETEGSSKRIAFSSLSDGLSFIFEVAIGHLVAFS